VWFSPSNAHRVMSPVVINFFSSCKTATAADLNIPPPVGWTPGPSVVAVFSYMCMSCRMSPQEFPLLRTHQCCTSAIRTGPAGCVDTAVCASSYVTNCQHESQFLLRACCRLGGTTELMAPKCPQPYKVGIRAAFSRTDLWAFEKAFETGLNTRCTRM
jgi:hypothetical protein